MKFNHKESDYRGMNIWIQAYENVVDQNCNDVNGNMTLRVVDTMISMKKRQWITY